MIGQSGKDDNMTLNKRLVLTSLLLVGIILLRSYASNAQTPDSKWSSPIDISAPVSTGQDIFGVLLCDPYQNLHVLWAKNYEGGSGIFYRNDLSDTWSDLIDVIAVPDPIAARLSVALSLPDNVIHLIWQNNFIRGDVYYSQVSLLNAGNSRSWTRPKILIPQVDSAQIHVDAAGIVRILFGASDASGRENGVYYIKSEDGGATWGDPIPIYETDSSLPSTITAAMAMDQAGRIHVGITIRSQEYSAYSEIGYLRSLDGGQTWSEYKVIDDKGTTFQGVSTLTPYAFGPDEVHLTWHDPRRMHQWSFDGGETWSEPIQIMPLSAGFGGANELVKDSAGVLHVVTAVANGVFSAAWENSQWTTPEQIDNRPMDPHGQKIAVCQGNQLHVVYDDRLGNETTVWYSRREVDAPHRKRLSLPPYNIQQTPVATQNSLPITTVSTVQPAISPTNVVYVITPQSVHTEAVQQPAIPLLISLAAVLVLVGGVFTFCRMGRSRP
jgi:hypothetical protein